MMDQENNFKTVLTPSMWINLVNSIEYYQELGYLYQDVPWFVDSKINSITFQTDLSMVGSAEQGFIDLELKNQLPDVKLVSLTPCYRDESGKSPFHFNYFMKVELYKRCKNIKEAENVYREMLDDAFKLFKIMRYCHPTIIETDIGKDIEINDIEVGSYGYREHDGLIWAYGTGLAEPRFTLVCNHM